MKFVEFMCAAGLVLALNSQTACYKEQSPVCNDFFSQPMEQWEKVFSTFPLDRQLEIYRCGMKKRPPTIGLSYFIAKAGAKVVPDLIGELKKEQDEWMQLALIDIFRILFQDGHLKGRTEVMQQLKETVSKMKIERIKKEATASLDEIEKNNREG